MGHATQINQSINDDDSMSTNHSEVLKTTTQSNGPRKEKKTASHRFLPAYFFWSDEP